MGGGGETSSTSNAYPPEITAAINSNVKEANKVASRPFTPYAQPFNAQRYLSANSDVQSAYDSYLKGFQPGKVVNPDEVRSQALQEYRQQYGDGSSRYVNGDGSEGGSSGYWENQNAPSLETFMQQYTAKNGQLGPTTAMTADEYARNHWLTQGYSEGRAGGPEMRDRVAGATADQTAAYDMTRDYAGASNLGTGWGVANQVAQYQPMMLDAAKYGSVGKDVSAYMNPYLDTAVQSALGDINRQGEAAGNAVRARMAGAGGFGGSRSAILEAETGRNYADASARTASDMRNTGYWNAQNVASQDANRMLSAETSNQNAGLEGQRLKLGAAGQMQSSATAQDQIDQGKIASMLGIGAQQQAVNQANLDAQYAEFLRATGYPVEMLKARQIPLSMNMPTTSTTTGPGADNTGAIVGGIGTIAMAAATAY